MKAILAAIAFCCFMLSGVTSFAQHYDDVVVSGKSTAQPLAFPGAAGFGREATGGRGGKLIKVTNLNDAGPGSLREAISASGPRIIVFDVSGTIVLKKALSIKNGNVTIAGQTAPGDGICLRDFALSVNADNVIIRFMRFRLGDVSKQESDALGGRFRKNIIIDHCSMSWSVDECTSFYANENFTLQWCIIAESLRNSAHSKGAHGYGGIFGGKNVSFHHNLLAHHDSRNPRFGEEAGKAFALTDLVDYRNNVIYNWGANSAYGGEGMNINIVNNYYKPGPATKKRERIFSPDKNKIPGTEVYGIWGKFFIDGNFVEGSTRATADNWTYGVYKQIHNSYGKVSDADKAAMKLPAQLPTGNVVTHSPQDAYKLVLKYAGASLKRDATDTRIINSVLHGIHSAGSGNGIIDSQSDVGGWPVLNSEPAKTDTDGDGMPDDWEKTHKLDPATPDASARDLSTVYDNVEVYLNDLVKSITEAQSKRRK